MNVKDLILSRPPKAVAAVFLEKYQNTPSDQEKAISRILQFIDSLHQIDPIDSGHLILGILQTEEDGDYLDPCLYYKEDLSALSLSASRLCGLESVEGLSEEEMEQLAQGKDLPDSYAFELSPWNEILGYELDTRNIQDVGADELCAAILWEMTFFGFEESHVEEERKRLEEILREDEKIRKLPEEEQKNYYHPIEDLFGEFHLPEKTEEEKREDHRQLCREIVTNKLRTFQVLTKYAQTDNTVDSRGLHSLSDRLIVQNQQAYEKLAGEE